MHTRNVCDISCRSFGPSCDIVIFFNLALDKHLISTYDKGCLLLAPVMEIAIGFWFLVVSFQFHMENKYLVCCMSHRD